MGNRHWTQKEKDYVTGRWGNASLPAIAKAINRTEIAVTLFIKRNELGSYKDNSELIPYEQLLTAIGKERGGNTDKVLLKYGFKIKRKKVNKSYAKMVCFDDFWKWAKDNPRLISWHKFEKYSLGKEPDWVEEVRKNAPRPLRKWTTQEERMLISYKKSGYLTNAKIGERLGRTEIAVKRKISALGGTYGTNR